MRTLGDEVLKQMKVTKSQIKQIIKEELACEARRKPYSVVRDQLKIFERIPILKPEWIYP